MIIEEILILSAYSAFGMITADVIGLKKSWDEFADKRDWKLSCDWCFSFHLSWIFWIINHFIYSYHDKGDLFNEESVCIIPISTIISFFIYRKLGE